MHPRDKVRQSWRVPAMFSYPARIRACKIAGSVQAIQGAGLETESKLFTFNGIEWVYACSSFNTGGVVQPGGEGLILPGSLVFHNGTSTPALEVQVYHSVRIQAGH